MKERNMQLKRYYRSIRSWLPCSRRLKKKVLDGIQGNISAYLEENPAADLASIEQRFGKPQQIAGACVEEMGSQELMRDLRVRRKIVSIVMACATAVIIIWTAFVTIALIDNVNAENGYIDIKIEGSAVED